MFLQTDLFTAAKFRLVPVISSLDENGNKVVIQLPWQAAHKANGILSFHKKVVRLDCDSVGMATYIGHCFPDSQFVNTSFGKKHFYFMSDGTIKHQAYVELDVIIGEKQGTLVPGSYHPISKGVYTGYINFATLSTLGQSDIDNLNLKKKNFEYGNDTGRTDRNDKLFWLARDWYHQCDSEHELYLKLCAYDAKGYAGQGTNHIEPKGRAECRNVAKDVWNWTGWTGDAIHPKFLARIGGVNSGKARREAAMPYAKEAVRLRKQGMSSRRIAKQIGKSQSQVLNYLNWDKKYNEKMASMMNTNKAAEARLNKVVNSGTISSVNTPSKTSMNSGTITSVFTPSKTKVKKPRTFKGVESLRNKTEKLRDDYRYAQTIRQSEWAEQRINWHNADVYRRMRLYSHDDSAVQLLYGCYIPIDNTHVVPRIFSEEESKAAETKVYIL